MKALLKKWVVSLNLLIVGALPRSLASELKVVQPRSFR